MNNTQKELKLVDRVSAQNYKPLPVVLSHGEGIWVTDVDGNRYIDMLSGYSSLNQGHRHPKIIKALKDQADRLTLSSRAFHNDKMGVFLEKLCSLTGYEKALPMNSGVEAVETAIKAARKWAKEERGIEEGEIIVFENNFHGRSITAVSFSSEQSYRSGFGPFTPGFVIVPYGDIDAVKKAISKKTIAILFEPIQGEGGIKIPVDGFFKGLREICDKNKILMIADEIQTGLGRTGKMLAIQHENVRPDIVCLGKAISGGVYPVSAIVCDDFIMKVFTPGVHGSTYGGNPLGAAVAIAALDVIVEENLCEKSLELGKYFVDKLRAIKCSAIKEIRGRGLFIGIEFKPEIGKVFPICEELMKKGLICKDTKNIIIRMAPPLVITREEIDHALEQIKEVFENIKI
ncbi:MAG: ornithine--oxo-acid transaminase [Firmicutes bacterium]|nr:ornithine--oxo-acid transaminase [Bacillota bacterium]MCL2255533.1 ornithine--oxo-acid transaminase [Bacillota bacterium]